MKNAIKNIKHGEGIRALECTLESLVNKGFSEVSWADTQGKWEYKPCDPQTREHAAVRRSRDLKCSKQEGQERKWGQK